MKDDIIFSIEIILIKRLKLKHELRSFISGGLTDFFDFIDLLGKNMIEVDLENKVYCVKYRKNKEVSRRLMPISFHELKQLLRKNKYKDADYNYIFLKKTIKYFIIHNH